MLSEFAENAQWHTLKACTLEGPLSMNGHAACSTGSQMFIYGGRQGRKVLHGLYKLCTGACSLSDALLAPLGISKALHP